MLFRQINNAVPKTYAKDLRVKLPKRLRKLHFSKSPHAVTLVVPAPRSLSRPTRLCKKAKKGRRNQRCHVTESDYVTESGQCRSENEIR